MRVVEKDKPRLYSDEALSSFLSVSPFDTAAAESSRSWIEEQEYDRQSLADILQRYNQEIGNDLMALGQIERLRCKKSVCIVAGQQLGLFGGPAYTALKAISCCLMAKKYDAVPIFWLATEDHDAGEVDHTYLLDNLGNLNKIDLHFPKDGSFVEDLQLKPEHWKVIEHFGELTGQVELFKSIKSETSYSRAMTKILLSLFKGTGLVFVEPYLLRSLAKEIFRREIADAGEIATVLQNTTQKLEQFGGRTVLDVSESTNLFFKSSAGQRLKVHFNGNHYRVEARTISKQELLECLETEPERFSTNAAARCVVQNSLFPVLASIAGPGEMGYHHQLKDYHAYHGIKMPWVTPRLSMTVVTPIAQEMMESAGLQPWDAIPHEWSQIVPDINEGAEELTQEWLQSAVKQFGVDLSDEVIRRHVKHQVNTLHRKVVLSRLRKKGIAPNALHYLHNLIHPRNQLQERVINWWEFQSHTQTSIVHELLNQLDEIPRGHLYCYL